MVENINVCFLIFVCFNTEKPPNKSSMRIVVDSESRKRTIGSGEPGAPAKKTWFDK
jgi:hypothetical protein